MTNYLRRETASLKITNNEGAQEIASGCHPDSTPSSHAARVRENREASNAKYKRPISGGRGDICLTSKSEIDFILAFNRPKIDDFKEYLYSLPNTTMRRRAAEDNLVYAACTTKPSAAAYRAAAVFVSSPDPTCTTMVVRDLPPIHYRYVTSEPPTLDEVTMRKRSLQKDRLAADQRDNALKVEGELKDLAEHDRFVSGRVQEVPLKTGIKTVAIFSKGPTRYPRLLILLSLIVLFCRWTYTSITPLTLTWDLSIIVINYFIIDLVKCCCVYFGLLLTISLFRYVRLGFKYPDFHVSYELFSGYSIEGNVKNCLPSHVQYKDPAPHLIGDELHGKSVHLIPIGDLLPLPFLTEFTLFFFPGWFPVEISLVRDLGFTHYIHAPIYADVLSHLDEEKSGTQVRIHTHFNLLNNVSRLFEGYNKRILSDTCVHFLQTEQLEARRVSFHITPKTNALTLK